LRGANWPEEIIMQAKQNADAICQAVPEQASIQMPEPAVSAGTEPASSNAYGEQAPVKQVSGEKRKFCFLALIAFLLSPIPFIGMGFAMTSLEMINKRHMTGTLLAILALLINIGVVLLVIFLVFQILTMDASQLTGFSKAVNDMFQLV
jgi:hypothetical protein